MAFFRQTVVLNFRKSHMHSSAIRRPGQEVPVWRSSFRGSHMSSESVKASHGELVSAAPVFRADSRRG